MSTNGKSRVLLLIIGILLVANIAMLIYFLGDKGPEKGERKGREGMMRSFLKKEIGFSDQQLQQFDTMNKQHKEKMHAAIDTVKNTKEQLYKELGSRAFDDSVINEVATRSAEMQKAMEIRMLAHFREVRKIATAEQSAKFDTVFYKIFSRKGDGKKKAGEKK